MFSSKKPSLRKRSAKGHTAGGWSNGSGAYHFSFTTPGWFFFLLMLLIIFAAVASGHNLLYLVVCLFFGSFIVMGNVAVMNLQKLRVKREVPETLYANTPAPVYIHVENERRWMDSFALEIREVPPEKGGAYGKVFFPLVTKGKETTRRYTLTLKRRGWHEFKGLEVVTRFPFGFWERYREIQAPDRVLAFPKVFRAWPEAMSNLTVDGEFMGTQWGAGDELLNFRGYQPGDPPRWIHWKNSAKTDRLTVALYHHPRNRHVIVCLRTQYPHGMGGNLETHFEEAVSWAATAIEKLLQRGVTVGYCDEHARIVPTGGDGQRMRLLTHLALVPLGQQESHGSRFHEGISSFDHQTILIEATPIGVRIEAGNKEQHFEEAGIG